MSQPTAPPNRVDYIRGVDFLQLLSYCGSLNTSFSIVTALWDKGPANEVRFPTQTEILSRLQKPFRFLEGREALSVFSVG
jgi:hypothetical protein